jgi:hypothetical protein
LIKQASLCRIGFSDGTFVCPPRRRQTDLPAMARRGARLRTARKTGFFHHRNNEHLLGRARRA